MSQDEFDPPGPIDSRIAEHDLNQFEIKLDYGIDPAHNESRYRVEAYFFIPKSLGVHGHTYGREHFYGDIQAYIRFKTPSMPLAALCDPNNVESPLWRLKMLLPSGVRSRDAGVLARLSYELRLFACLLRAQVRDRVRQIDAHLLEVRPEARLRPQALRALAHDSGQLIAEVRVALDALREMRPRFLSPALPPWMREVYQHVDEYLSLACEGLLTGLLDRIDATPEAAEGRLTPCRQQLTAFIAGEQAARRTTPYLEPHVRLRSDESQLYRRGLLKKFVMSVLFLEFSRERESRATHLAAAAGAGVAMVVATVIALVTQRWYALNSLPFLFTLIVSYVLKDRLKDAFKVYFATRLNRHLWDYNVRIEDPQTGQTLGRCRETFSYVNPQSLSADILQCRHAQASSTLEQNLNREVVIRYDKDVHLLGRTIAGLYGRLHEVNDIIRFNIANFLARADDPVHVLRWYNPDADKVEAIDCPKVYHINVILALRAKGLDQPRRLEHVRVIVDKRGIRRIESA